MNLKGKEINNCYKIIKKIDENNLFTIWMAQGLFSPLTFTLKFLNKEDKEYIREEYLKWHKVYQHCHCLFQQGALYYQLWVII